MTIIGSSQGVFRAATKRTAVERGQGIVEAVVSVFGVRDRGGEVVQRGAFEKSIASWRKRGSWPPALWSHSSEVADVVGRVTDMRETAEGLHVAMQLAIDDSENARMLFDRLREKSITQWSFAYLIVRSHPSDDGRTLFLDELDVTEVSACVAGMNPETRTVSVKAATMSGRDIHNLNVMRRRIDAALASSGSKSSADEMARRIDALSRSSDDIVARVRAECLAAGMTWEEPRPKRTPTYSPPSPLQDATGVFGYGNLTRPADTRRVEMKLHQGGGIGGEDLDATLAAAEQRLVTASAEYEQAKLDVAHTKERIARYDEQHRGG